MKQNTIFESCTQNLLLPYYFHKITSFHLNCKYHYVTFLPQIHQGFLSLPALLGTKGPFNANFNVLAYHSLPCNLYSSCVGKFTISQMNSIVSNSMLWHTLLRLPVSLLFTLLPQNAAAQCGKFSLLHQWCAHPPYPLHSPH